MVLLINHWFQFSLTKKFKEALSTVVFYVIDHFFASIIYVDEFASLWICICTFFLLDHHFKSGQIFDVFSLDHHFKPGQIFDAVLLKKLVSDHFTDTLTNGGWSLKTYRCSILQIYL